MPQNIKIIGYSDLIGFSGFVVDNIDSAKGLLSEYYNIAQREKIVESFEKLEIFLFSDFLFVQGENVADVVNYLCSVYRSALRYSKSNLDIPMLPRGGVARGEIIIQNRREEPRVTKNFVVSPALCHAVKMDTLVKGQRLLISAAEHEVIDHFWNRNISATIYDQPSINFGELFPDYRYQDILWARDLKKERADSKHESAELLKIAAKLYKHHYFQPETVQVHYAETLRICLLSYSSLLEPSKQARGLIQHLVDEILLDCPHKSVWLGFLEFILLSSDYLCFQDDEYFLKFIRKAKTSTTWDKVCSVLENREHEQLSARLEDMLDSTIYTK